MMMWSERGRRGIILSLAIVIPMLVFAAPALAQTTPQDQQNADFIAGRLITLKKEILGFKEKLKDGQAIVLFYEILTRDFIEYKDSMRTYSNNCADRQKEYDDMRKENYPFIQRYWPAIQRCQNDRDGFNANLQRFGLEVNRIERDVNIIKIEVGKLENSNNRTEQEIKVFESTERMNGHIKSASDQVGKFKKPLY